MFVVISILVGLAVGHLASPYHFTVVEESMSKVGNSARTFQGLSDQISDLRNTSDSCRLSCEEEKRQMTELYQKKVKLEALVNDFQNNNEEYIKMTKAVEEKVLGGKIRTYQIIGLFNKPFW